MKREILNRLNTAIKDKQQVALVTEIESGNQTLVFDNMESHGPTLEELVLSETEKALKNDCTTSISIKDRDFFIHVHSPALRLFIVGAVHITKSLVQIANLAGYNITVIDPRSAFGDEERFPGVHISNAWPDEYLNSAKPDNRTALVTLTHDPKIDDPALECILAYPVFYIGSLGSNKTHRQRLERLHEKGFNRQQTSRIHGPIGLNIGAKSPTEIAIAIMAEITESRRICEKT